MPRRDPVSIFYGPHRRFDDLATWPPTVQLHLQLFGLQPGSEATPPLPPELFTQKILPPSPTPGAWSLFLFPILFNVFHTITDRRVEIFTILGGFQIFALTVPFAIDRWAYNSITDPAGVFAFNGTATLSWKEP